MKTFLRFVLPFVALATPLLLQAADTGWPRIITTDKGKITLYEPQPESLNGNKLSARAAISIVIGDKEPIFGAIWADAILETDRDSRTATLESIKISNIKFPDVKDQSKIEDLEKLLESEIPKWDLDISIDRIVASLNNEKTSKSDALNMTPPQIIYANEPTLLVVIDGAPKLQQDKNLGLQKIVNTPFIILQSSDKNFYLYVSEKWFKASAISGQWAYTRSLPKDIEKAGKEIAKAEESDDDSKAFSSTIPIIAVSTTPAELIQSNGKAEFKPIQNTSLLYVSNSEDNIFMDISNQQYYILLSGRWYSSRSLTAGWVYTAGENLPADFKKIPEGSEKDIVLAAVPGTNAAKEAAADAQVPQTAKVDRKKATTTVTYDGNPKFEEIPNTNMMYAINTASTVLKEGNKYYTVDNGVWFESSNANGPWKVSTERPEDVDKIPADNPTYNVKYVYIYDVTPEYVYMGYTPGYLGCYVYAGTVVYGTGFYYHPWYGAMYYPRPVTWGFSMHYNPWTGWSMGIGVNVGYFHFGFGYNFRYGYAAAGGWWGPPVYHPPFHYPYSHFYGPVRPVVVAPHNNIVINNFNNINVNVSRTNNVYNHRTDVTTNNVRRTTNNLGSTQRTATQNLGATRSREPNNVHVGQDGNIYRREANGQTQERRNNSWQPTQSSERTSTVQQSRDRGQNRTANFQQSHTRYTPRTNGRK